MLRPLRKLLPLVFMLAAGIPGMAQQNNTTPADSATWIKMIDDPNVNYYVAVKTYEDYWKTHPKPADPEDRLSDKDHKERDEDELAPVTKEQKIYEARMIYQMKRFETWMREEKPYVQEDGRILSQQERLEMWKKLQEEKAK